ncbi:NUDIX domain-containing protein [Streptomyces cyaneofuscatus]|uniref:NUDIX domain-containing protein n=1 Tax=Streptomyces cyaneofuscatus TaxID=66883 RepID=UPI003649240A
MLQRRYAGATFLRLTGRKTTNPSASPGGGIDPGEQPVEASARELRDETGRELVAARLRDTRTCAVQRHGVDGNLTALSCAVDLKAGAPVVGETDGSTDAAVWTPLADLHDSMLLSGLPMPFACLGPRCGVPVRTLRRP